MGVVQELGPLTRTMDGDDVLAEELGKRPPALQMFETATVALQKPLQVLLNAAAVVVSGRFLAAFLQIVLEVHAEHDHIAPGWQGACHDWNVAWVVTGSDEGDR